MDIKKNNIVNLILLYFIVVAAGSILSVLYLYANYYSKDFRLSFIAVIAFSAILAFIVRQIILVLKINNRIGAFITVLLGFCTFTYVKWSIFFGIFYYISSVYEADIFASYNKVVQYSIACFKYPGDFIKHLMHFNTIGTWYIERDSSANIEVTGILLALVWIGEFVLLLFPSLQATIYRYGCLIYYNEKWSWALENISKIPFDKFSKEEIESLSSGNINVVLQREIAKKPNGRKIYHIVQYTLHGDLTGFIAIYLIVSFNNKKNKIPKSSPIFIGKENAAKLEADLREKYKEPVSYFDASVDKNLIREIENELDTLDAQSTESKEPLDKS